MRSIIRFLSPLVLLLALLLPAGGATAAPAQSERTEQILAHYNMCTGEYVELTGTIHYVTKVDSDGSTFILITTHAQGAGDQGNTYVFNDSFRLRAESTDLIVDEFHRLTSEGSAPNQVLIIHYDTVNGSTFEFECRG